MGHGDGTRRARHGLDPVHDPFFPPRYGNRLILAEFPPDAHVEDPRLTPEETVANAEATFPGLIGIFVPDAPGFRTTLSVAYDYIISGELWLEIDDGEAVRLPAGTVVIQNGGRHAWQQKQRTALMLSVPTGARDVS